MAERQRHVQLSVIEDYLAKGIDGVFGIEGEPPARLLVEPSNGLLAIRFPTSVGAPDVTSFENLSVDQVLDEGQTWDQLSVQLEDNLGEAYAVLCAIVDRVQLYKLTFSAAVRDALESISEILAARSTLSTEKQLGLAGELLTLQALATEIGSAHATDAWRGPFAEEHDFGLPDADVEVKVTLNEKRQHWISSVTQLVPTGHRPLYLLSIQLTRAGAGLGWSLPSLVSDVRSLESVPAESFDLGLASAGYRKKDADLYGSRCVFRTPPAFFLIDSEFPSLTRAALESSVSNSQRIVDVRYRIDLTGLTKSPDLFSFDLDVTDGAQN